MNHPLQPLVENAPEQPPAGERCSVAPGSAYRTPDGVLICCLCQCEMEWEDCSVCGGDGFFDGYEEDPNWYQPGEMADCSQCGGEGGAHICQTRDCKTFTCLRVLPSPNSVSPGKPTYQNPEAPKG